MSTSRKPSSNRLVVFVVAAVLVACVSWLSWAWSPSAPSEDLGHNAVPAPPQEEVAGRQSAPEAVQRARGDAKPAEPSRSTAVPQEPSSAPPQPERIPTPHPMSLDQARPPTQQGPLRELKHQYAGESRAQSSSAQEAKLRTLLTTVNIPAELVHAIACRRSTCKVDMSWTPERYLAYVIASGRLKHKYGSRVAAEPAIEPAADGSQPVSLYIDVTATTSN